MLGSRVPSGRAKGHAALPVVRHALASDPDWGICRDPVYGGKPPKEAVVQDPAAPGVTARLAPALGLGPGEALVPEGERAPVWVPVPWWDRDVKGPAGSHSRSNAP
ncbi:hypothetical protein NtRootA1_02520 [Arthrobacter sp. NtRootA1]|nr:hypothetical protein NtRootA1_02520 [Arthrobacter sp. NtRootA1]